jgi:hypothetical protein
MTKKTALEVIFPIWQRQFAADAVADDAAEIRRHIEYLEMDCSPADLLMGTDMLLFAILIYMQMDGVDCESFIRRQRYRLCGEDLPHYCLTFNFGKKHFGRVLTDEAISGVDFADLVNHPWDEYRTAGFHEVYISRLDGEPIEKTELEALHRRVTNDMYFDYSEAEVGVDVYMTENDDTALMVAVEYMD